MLSAAESWSSPAIAEMLSASSNSVVLSILWAGRYKISNNLISTSKFHRLPELAALLMWVYRDQGRGPLRERKIWVKSCPPSLQPTPWVTPKTSGEIHLVKNYRNVPIQDTVGTTWSMVFQNRVFTRNNVSKKQAVWVSPIHHLLRMRKVQYHWKTLIL